MSDGLTLVQTVRRYTWACVDLFRTALLADVAPERLVALEYSCSNLGSQPHAIQGFSHYNLHAPRELLDWRRDFYVDVVGLQPGPRPPFASYGYWLYAGGEAVPHLS